MICIAAAAVAGSLPLAIAGAVVVGAGVILVATGLAVIKGLIDEHKRQIDEAVGTP